jgi:hypothetical protein
VFELLAAPGVRAWLDRERISFPLDPELHLLDTASPSFSRPWEVAWGLRVGKRSREVSTSHDRAHLDTLSRALGTATDSAGSACVRVEGCPPTSLGRLFFTPAVVRGDSAQLQLHYEYTFHRCGRTDSSDLTTTGNRQSVLFVHTGALWTVASIGGPFPPNIGAPC